MAPLIIQVSHHQFCYFRLLTFDSDQGCTFVWEGVRILEGFGLHFRAFCLKLIHLHECTHREHVSIDNVLYWPGTGLMKSIFFYI